MLAIRIGDFYVEWKCWIYIAVLGKSASCMRTYVCHFRLCELVIDACRDNPCGNFGSCVAHEDYSYMCSCRLGKIQMISSLCEILFVKRVSSTVGYIGLHCEHKIPCEENKCQNGGECELNHDIEEGYRCLCEDGYHGIHCEKGGTTLQPSLYNLY